MRGNWRPERSSGFPAFSLPANPGQCHRRAALLQSRRFFTPAIPMTRYFDAELIGKYSQSGPRYTSYPTAVEFHERFTAADYVRHLEAGNAAARDLSLYVHIPFCEHVCYYCGCNKIITRNHDQSDEYLDQLERDIARQAAHIDKTRRVIQLHLGGGTPTFLNHAQLRRLLAMLHEHFPNFAADDAGEYSIEIDPRTVSPDDLRFLRELGFNRVSFGVQDFDPAVQQAVNRIQSFEHVRDTIAAARDAGYHSISADLIYGLPLQTVRTFSRTLEQIRELAPDRLAVFNYAHMPHIFGAQKQINAADLPDAPTKLQLLQATIEQLTDGGYEFIGLDHFALPGDSLVRHQREGTLYRNFQGYSTFSACELLGFGISAISMLDGCYSQHEKARSRYYQALNNGGIPVLRGIELTRDDRIRHHVITEIMCNLHLDLKAVSTRWQINAADYFAREWQALQPLAADDLIKIDGDRLEVRPLGRLLIRNIAMVFDAYLHKAENSKRFSKVI